MTIPPVKPRGKARTGKKLGFLEKVFRFLGFLKVV